MRIESKYWLLIIMILLLSVAAAAMDWPLPDARVTRNFGLNDNGNPVLGIDFAGEGELSASGSGMIFFSRSENDSASRLPSPFGAWTAMDHGDGLISIYARYRDEESRPPAATSAAFLEMGDAVASAGISGWSNHEGFYFVLFDRKERRWVNASMVIPPFPDTTPPQITSVKLRNSSGKIFEGAQLRNLNQGSYTIIVSAFDTLVPRGEPLAPHRITCSVNGAEAGSLSFETISAKNGLISAKKIYSPVPAFEAGEVYLNRGQAILEILVHDIAGNSGSSISRITVE